MYSFFQIKHGKAIAFWLIHFTLFIGYSQEVQVDSNFNKQDDGLSGDGFDGTVRSVAIQTDGKLLVGGEFLNFNGNATPYFCRLLTDGSKDPTFILGSGFNGRINASVIQPDGKIIIGGSFTSFNGAPVGRLIRLNVDGSRDSSFDTSVAVGSGIIYGLALQADGKLIAVGSFTKYNETTVNRIARLLPNGTLDSSFVTGTAATSTIDDVVIGADGKIILSGTFTSFNGNSSYSKLVRLHTNGSIDTSFSIGAGFDDSIEAIAIQPDGKIIVGGSFLNYNGTTQNRIVRLNSNGVVDSSFLSGTGFNNGAVHTILVASSGILIGGNFSDQYKTTDVNRLVLLKSNGTIATDFTIGEGPATATVYALAASSDSFFVGGSFSVFDELKQGRLAKISFKGELDNEFLTSGVGFDKSVNKLIPLADGSCIAFGSFTQFNGKLVSRIAKINSKGELDTTFNSNQIGANNTVKEVLVLPDGKLLVAGNFTNYNDSSIRRMVRLHANGTVDSSFNIGSGFNSMVHSIVLQNDGKIIAAGSFSSYKGVSVNKVIRLLANGDLDSSFNIGINPNDNPTLVGLQADGKVLVGGEFSTFNGVASNRLIRLNVDGSVDTSFNVGTGFVGFVYAITLQNDGKILVGGSFTSFNGQSNRRIVRLNPDGSQDTSFNSGLGFSSGIVRTIAVQTNGSILLGGSFSSKYNGINVKRMLRLFSNGTYDSSFPISINGEVLAIALVKGGALIGGNFNSISGISKHRIAKLLFCQEGTIWDGTNWSNGLPTIDKTVIFNSNYNIETDLKICSCVVNSGVRVGVKNSATLELTLHLSGQGKLIFENNSSLYQFDDAIINSGSIEYIRKSTPMRKTDYTYWSTPVAGQQLKLLSPNSPSATFYSFNSQSNNWQNESTNAKMIPGKGYIFQAPQNFSETTPSVFDAVFSGIPNNGLLIIPNVKTVNPILIGNPYPSALNADAFILENQNVLQGSLYFWTHNTPITNGQYTSNDYAVYNIFGGIGTAAKNSGVNNKIPNGKIASGQAFFVVGTNQLGAITFKNSMRLKADNNLFFKIGNSQKAIINSNFEKHRIWLNLSNKQGLFKQILLGYATGATNERDVLFDGLSLDGNEWLDFYSLNNGDKNSIQARALPFEVKDAINIGYRAKQEGSFAIGLDDFDGLFVNQSIYLEDLQESKIQDLKKGEYSFFTTKGTFDNRFKLLFQEKNKVLENTDVEVQVVTQNNQIQISSSKEMINKVVLYSLDGKQLYKASELKIKTHLIEAAIWKSKILIIQITLETGEVVRRKFLF